MLLLWFWFFSIPPYKPAWQKEGSNKPTSLFTMCPFAIRSDDKRDAIQPTRKQWPVKQLQYCVTYQKIIDDPLHRDLKRGIGKSFSIYGLADETNAPGLLCQFSLLRVKQTAFPGPAQRLVCRQPSLKCPLSTRKWYNRALHRPTLCYLSWTEL